LSEDFISKISGAFVQIKKEIDVQSPEGRERQFRVSLAENLFNKVLGWTRETGKGRYYFAEIRDITLYDDEEFPVILVETKSPDVKITSGDETKLGKRLEELRPVEYGILTNGHKFFLYKYDPTITVKLREIVSIDMDSITGTVERGFALSPSDKERILKLAILERDRYVKIEDSEYFEKSYRRILVKDKGIEELTKQLKNIIANLTIVMKSYFNEYYKRKDYSGAFLREIFDDWLKFSVKEEEFSKGNEEQKKEIVEIFCRETAYVILGRILFTRICEDKGIIGTPKLSGSDLASFLEQFKKKENVYLFAFEQAREEIKGYYKHLHELGIFDWWWISQEKRELLSEENEKLQSELDKELNLKIRDALRKMHRFDFSEVDRDVLGDVYQGYLPSDERKRLGEFYTPKEVIDYILDAIEYTPDKDIRGKTLLDPACGSGGFLVEATRRLIESYKRAGLDPTDPSNAKTVLEEVVRCIYGLDIHPFACFIAEMNLLFQLIDLYDVARKGDKKYRLPRFNIYRTDSLRPPEKLEEGLPRFFDNSRKKAYSEDTEGANIVKNMKFDFIVANPPYVRVHKLSTIQKEEYGTIYESAKGLYDIYCLFIERGLALLKRDCGKLGYICSNRFMTRSYGEVLRKILTGGLNGTYFKIDHILDFGDSGVFEEATNYPCILTLTATSKWEEIENNTVSCVQVFKSEDELLENIRRQIRDEKKMSKSFEVFGIPQKVLSEKAWTLMPNQESEIIRKMNSATPCKLADLVEGIQVGVQTGSDRIFVVNQETIEKYNLKGAPLKKFLRGEDVRKWSLKWKGLYLIYPYTMKGNETCLLSEEELREIAPNIWRYLCEHKATLLKRWGVKKVFYELPTARRFDWFEAMKIITPDVSDKNNFALDKEGFYFSKGTVYGIILKRDVADKIELILGILNSKLLEFYFKHVSPMHAGGYFRYNTQYLEQLPIKLPQTEKEKVIASKIVGLTNQVVRSIKELGMLKNRVDTLPNSYFKGDEKFEILANIAGINLSKKSYKIFEKSLRTERLTDVYDKENFRIIITMGEYIDLFSKYEQLYVYEWLRTKIGEIVTRDELIRLNIPSERLKEILDELESDKKHIEHIKKTINDIEMQIDNLVYELYDITEEERWTIEQYLARYKKK